MTHDVRDQRLIRYGAAAYAARALADGAGAQRLRIKNTMAKGDFVWTDLSAYDLADWRMQAMAATRS